MLRFLSLVISFSIFSSAVFAFSFEAQKRSHLQVVGSSTVYPFTAVIAETFGRDTKFKTPIVEIIIHIITQEKRLLKMVWNFYVVHRGGARASILVTIIVVRIPTPAEMHPQVRIVYDIFVDDGHK